MKNPLGGGNGMTPHYSGTTLDAQQRYASGTKEILENFFNKKPQNPANIIIAGSEYSFRRLWRGAGTVLMDVHRGLRYWLLWPAQVDCRYFTSGVLIIGRVYYCIVSSLYLLGNSDIFFYQMSLLQTWETASCFRTRYYGPHKL